MRPLLAPLLVLVAACAAVGGDPWRRSEEVFRDGDVVALVDASRSSDGLELRWVGVRAEGDTRLTAVRVIVFCDANGDRVPQGTEQLTRWATQSSEPVAEFAAAASFRATNLKPEVMQTLCVFTEVSVAGRDAPLQQTRAFP